MQFKYKTTAVFLAVVFLFSLDRWLKSLALAGGSADLLGQLITFGFGKNFGIAFSLPLSGKPLLILVGLIESCLLFLLLRSCGRKDFLRTSAYMLIIAGAASNLLDRVRYGYVIDYFNIAYFTILNVADIMIFSGVVWLLFLFHKKTAD
jgi:signal peptidase II